VGRSSDPKKGVVEHMELISLSQATRRLGGVSVSLLRKAIADGRLEAVRIGRRVLVDVEFLETRARSGQLFNPKQECEFAKERGEK